MPDNFACHVCKKIARKKGIKYVHEKGWSTAPGGHCVLCNHEYCSNHASKRRRDRVDVCEISHVSYFRNHRQKPDIYPTVDKYLEATS